MWSDGIRRLKLWCILGWVAGIFTRNGKYHLSVPSPTQCDAPQSVLIRPAMATILGWGLLSQFLPLRYFSNSWGSWEHTPTIEYHVCICKVSPQLSCGETYQIWMWFREYKGYFYKIDNFTCGEVNERGFSNPYPWFAKWRDPRQMSGAIPQWTPTRGGGYSVNFLRSVIFRIFQCYQNTRYLLKITYIFDRCRRSSAKKYVCKIENSAYGDLNERSFSTTHPKS